MRVQNVIFYAFFTVGVPLRTDTGRVFDRLVTPDVASMDTARANFDASNQLQIA
jgi:hypothetical protein